MKIYFLLNPTQRKDLWDIRDQAAKAARVAGWTAYFGEVDRSKPKSTERLVTEALEEGCSRIAIVGGDGTYHRVVTALHEKERLRDTELALIPAGTCNDFSRLMEQSPSRFPEALRTACRGNVRKVDL